MTRNYRVICRWFAATWVAPVLGYTGYLKAAVNSGTILRLLGRTSETRLTSGKVDAPERPEGRQASSI